MSFHGWMALAGVLLLLITLLSAYIKSSPVTTSVIYLFIGIALSPLGFDLITIDVIESKVWLEYLTEFAVIVSLFIGGLKLRLPPLNRAWFAAYMLALPTMLFSIAGIAILGNFLFGIPAPIAVLLGSFLAPTDPVLASAVSVENAEDKDRMRYGLSGEAGFNDGMAFPFVIFGLMWLENGALGDWLGKWALHRLIWAVPVGLIIGFVMGKVIGYLTVYLRSKHRDRYAPNDFLALALISLSYVAAEAFYAWGFLAVFAAGLGLRQTEIKLVKNAPPSERKAAEKADSTLTDEAAHPPAEEIAKNEDTGNIDKPSVAVGFIISDIISFGDTVERILEFMLVLLVGIALAVHWNWSAIPLALLFFFVIRPLFALIFLAFTPTTRIQKFLMAWFGIKGIGSIYYLAYALNHNWTEQTKFVTDLTISTIALSVLIHGLSSQPILKYYEKTISKKEAENV